MVMVNQRNSVFCLRNLFLVELGHVILQVMKNSWKKIRKLWIIYSLFISGSISILNISCHLLDLPIKSVNNDNAQGCTCGKEVGASNAFLGFFYVEHHFIRKFSWSIHFFSG